MRFLASSKAPILGLRKGSLAPFWVLMASSMAGTAEKIRFWFGFGLLLVLTWSVGRSVPLPKVGFGGPDKGPWLLLGPHGLHLGSANQALSGGRLLAGACAQRCPISTIVSSLSHHDLVGSACEKDYFPKTVRVKMPW